MMRIYMWVWKLPNIQSYNVLNTQIGQLIGIGKIDANIDGLENHNIILKIPESIITLIPYETF